MTAGVSTPEGALLLDTAHVMRAMRAAMKHNDLPGMVAALERARDRELSAVVQGELAAVLREFDERAIASELLSALEDGALVLRSVDVSDGGGGDGDTEQQLDFDELDVSAIDGALQYADQLGYRSQRVQQLVDTVKAIRQLRIGKAGACAARLV